MRSGKYIDFFFPGYKNQFDSSFENMEFNTEDFCKAIEKIENMSKWHYSGNTEFLFLEYSQGKISFEHTISLNIDQLLQNQIISSVPGLMEDIIRISKTCTQASEFAKQLNYLEASKGIIKLIRQWITNKFHGIHVGTFYYRNLSKK